MRAPALVLVTLAVVAALLVAQETPAAKTSGTIFGVVVDEKENIVTEARVTLYVIEGRGERVFAETRTRGAGSVRCDGFFTFLDVPAGSYRLSVERRGYRQEQKLPVGLVEGEIKFLPVRVHTVRIVPARLNGVVTVGKDRLSGAVVRLYAKGNKEPLKEATTDSSGRFDFQSLEGGEYELTVSAGKKRLYREELTLQDGRRLSRTIRLEEKVYEAIRGTIIGTVRDSQGKPLKGVSISLVSPPRGLRHTRARTDEKGGYRIPYLPPGKYVVRASLAGYEQAEREGVQVSAGRSRRVDFRLKKKE